VSGLLLLAAGVMFGQSAQEQVAPNVNHEINVWVAKDVAPGPKIRLNINTRNVRVVHVDAFPVDGRAWLVKRDLERNQPPSWPKPTGASVLGWDVTVARPGQTLNKYDNYFSRQVNLPIMRPGVYLLALRGEGKTAYGVVNVTNLAVLLKRSKTKLLTWVTDSKSGALKAGASVSYVNEANQTQATGTTAADGTIVFNGQLGRGTIIVRSGDDLAGVNCGYQDPDGQLQAHFQTDRPIYRPGQTVYYKAVLRRIRGQKYDVVHDPDVVVQLRDPRDNPLDQFHVKPNDMGSVSGSFKIPQEGLTGPYSIRLEVGQQTAFQTFTVAAYRKPEYKVDITTNAKRYLAGETITFRVNAAYYFGAPVPNAKVRWVARSSGMPYFTPDPDSRYFYGGDGNLYPSDTYASQPFAGEGEVFTDNAGKVDIQIKTDPKGEDQQYSLEVTVEDASRRQVQGASSAPVYAANKRIGLTSPQSTTALGGLIPVEVRATDLDGRPVGGPVTIRLFETYWVEKEGRTRERLLSEQHLRVPPTGRLNTNLPAKREGVLIIRAEAPDGTGRTAKAEMSAYVAGPDYKEPKERTEPTMDVRLDKRLYKPGDPVLVYVSTNRPKRPILVTEEGREIFDYRVLPAGTSQRKWRVTASVAQSPNAFIAAMEHVDARWCGTEVILPVPDPSRLFSLTVTPEKKEVEPGDRAKLHVRAVDYQGKPVKTEVALSVVDEAIYALSPDTTADPYGFYWGRRPNWVGTGQSAPEEMSGGAYQPTNAVAPVRQRFEDTAYWNPTVETDSDGNATVAFDVPGNLTTWRATARGFTTDTQVGVARDSFMASRALTLRLATPRQVAQGDEFTLIGTLNNRSAKAVHERIEITPDGIEIPGGPVEVDVPAHGEKIVKWALHAVKVPTDGKFTLLASATGPDVHYSDSLKVSVPIVPKGVRDTVQTGAAFTHSASASLQLAPEAIREGAVLSLRVFAGVGASANDAAADIFSNVRYGSPWGANALMAATAVGVKAHSDDVREALALLSRTQLPDGWGWWEDSPANPVITANVGHALALGRHAGMQIFDQTWQTAKNGARAQFDRTNLWEFKAQLAATLVELEADNGMENLAEVRERGLHLSPFAQLRMAEALVSKDKAGALSIVKEIRKEVSTGPESSYLPVGDGIGWTATEFATNAELLTVLVRLNEYTDLQRQLVNWLTLGRGPYRSGDENAALARALILYLSRNPSASEVGPVTATIGGQTYALVPSTVSQSSTLDLPLASVPIGPIRLDRKSGGEVFYTATVRYYRRILTENSTGIRVSRRYELKNAAGIWTEVNRVIHPSEPVRCTVVVWGDDREDAVRVTEPIPTGFEFTDSDVTNGAREDVRDGAVVHYIVNSGAPVYFRYYLRAESDGRLTALPAIAEYMRRPDQKGQSAATPLVVHP